MLNTILLFFNIGAPELILIVLVVIIFFGSKKIPELMRGLGKGMREFKNATSDIQEEINKSVRTIEKDVDVRPRRESTPSSTPNKDSGHPKTENEKS